MDYSGAPSIKSRRFRSLAAAVMVALVTLFAVTQQAHAHAVPHSGDQQIPATLLTANDLARADATQHCCHLGGSGIACAASILSSSHRERLDYFARKSLGQFPSNAKTCDSLAHAPPNPPPIPVRF